MSFASPIMFAFAALAVPIVVFYILKVRLRRVPVSTNLFWKQIYDEKPPRSIWQYLRHLLSLLAQLLFLLLLVFAVADPYFSSQLLQARRVVVVIDNSASMQAQDVEPSRFESAIDAALDTADGLRFRDEMAIVLAGAEPEVVVGMSGHVPTLKRALESITVSDNPTELDLAIKLGHQLIGDHPHGQVLVFTDGCADSLRNVADVETPETPTTSPAATVGTSVPTSVASESLVLVGSSDADNVGITQFQVRRSLADPLGYEILVAVRNASDQSINGRVELELDGVPVDVLPMKLEPEGVFTRSLEKTSLEGGTLVATLTELRPAGDDDAPADEQLAATDAETASSVNSLLTDDTAWSVLPPRTIQNVLIVSAGNLFLQKVFEANPLVNVTVQKDFPDEWPSDGIIVLHREVPEKLPPGDLFIVDPLNDCDGWKLGEPIENPIITDLDKESALMTHVRLDNVLMPQARQLNFEQPPRVLAGSVSGDPVYAEIKRPNGRCLVLSVNINEGDLAFRTAFPIMVTNSLGWFAGQTGELRQSLSTGAITRVELPETADGQAGDISLQSPGGGTKPLSLHGNELAESAAVLPGSSGTDAETATPETATPESNSPETATSETVVPVQDRPAFVSTPPLDECGVWNVVSANTPEGTEPLATLAVNLASDSETDLRPPVELSAQNSDASVSGWLTRPIWFYLVVAACLLSVIEWWLYQRRMIT